MEKMTMSAVRCSSPMVPAVGFMPSADGAETLYRSLFHTARVGMLTLDGVTGRITEVNPFLLAMLGCGAEKVLGKDLEDGIPWQNPEEGARLFALLQGRGTLCCDRLPLALPNGRRLVVEFSGSVCWFQHRQVLQCNLREVGHGPGEVLPWPRSAITVLADRGEAGLAQPPAVGRNTAAFAKIIGQSEGLQRVLHQVEQVAATNTTVLVLGETGTGKELIASALHELSPRGRRPLVTVNCAALPDTLVESELFGREKGAYTGADNRQKGRFEVAHCSTLCLDEIGELPLAVQAKLLRAIQQNEFQRVGGTETIKVDVRIVASTNLNCQEAVKKGTFRQDLYYRLNIFPITIPPLRERPEDILLLAQAFMDECGRSVGKEFTEMGAETKRALQAYSWPGNVRELKSAIERAVILGAGPILNLPEKLSSPTGSSGGRRRTMKEMERDQILLALAESRGRIEGQEGAAHLLGLHPSTLRARMHKLGVQRREAGVSH